jgi:hypothetical protein
VNIFALEIWDDTLPLVTYYTVRWDNAMESETEKFFRRFMADDVHKRSFTEIVALLELFGEQRGAKQRYFERWVDEASELPPKQSIEVDGIEINYADNVLRLFCVRINDHIVILFNGGLKSSQATQDSPDLASKFRDSKKFAKKIWDAIHTEMIIVDEARHKLISDNHYEEELLIY